MDRKGKNKTRFHIYCYTTLKSIVIISMVIPHLNMNIHIHFSAKDFSTESSFIFWKTGSETRLISMAPTMTLDHVGCPGSTYVCPLLWSSACFPPPLSYPPSPPFPPTNSFSSPPPFPFHCLKSSTTYIPVFCFSRHWITHTHLTNNHTAWFIAMHSIWCSQKYVLDIIVTKKIRFI